MLSKDKTWTNTPGSLTLRSFPETMITSIPHRPKAIFPTNKYPAHHLFSSCTGSLPNNHMLPAVNNHIPQLPRNKRIKGDAPVCHTALNMLGDLQQTPANQKIDDDVIETRETLAPVVVPSKVPDQKTTHSPLVSLARSQEV
jgi:hypothetical protein